MKDERPRPHALPDSTPRPSRRAIVAAPLCTLVGLCALAVRPGVTVLVAVQLARRSTDYVLVKPARELLFTVVPREAKYEARSFVDTFVYRAGDAIGALTAALLGVRLVPVTLVLCAVWGAVAIVLGRAFASRSGASRAPGATEEAPRTA